MKDFELDFGFSAAKRYRVDGFVSSMYTFVVEGALLQLRRDCVKCQLCAGLGSCSIQFLG